MLWHWLDDGCAYTASHTGIVFNTEDGMQVLSYVNGTMCINPLENPVWSMTFDGTVFDIMPKQSNVVPVGTAWFDHYSGCYTMNPVQYPHKMGTGKFIDGARVWLDDEQASDD